MKNKEKKVLKARLFATIKRVLQKDNKADLTNKSEKALKRSIRQIVKKTNKRRDRASTKRINKTGVNSDKMKMDGVAIV